MANSIALSLRINKRLKQALENEAKSTGNSLARTVREHLLRSFNLVDKSPVRRKVTK